MQNIETSTLLIEHVRRQCEQHGISLQQPLWVAYSGGCDSHCLLHILSHLIPPHNIHVLHVNHRLSPHANTWEQHCRHITKTMGAQFTSISITSLDPSGPNLEKQARDARYHAFTQCLPGNAILFLAHHQDDQAETVLMRLMRGSGPAGLAGMPIQRKHQHFMLFRPLLAVSRDALYQYAQHHTLHWVEDESNANSQFTRNFLRHEVMPLLAQHTPSLHRNLARTADHCRMQMTVNDHTIDALLTHMTAGNTLHIPSLLAQSTAHRKAIIRAWHLQHAIYPLNSQQVNVILDTVVHAAIDRQPSIRTGAHMITRYQQYLYHIAPPPTITDISPRLWPADESTHVLRDLGIQLQRPLNTTHSLLQQTLEIRFREGGERFHPLGRCGSHPLKKLFQDWKIPPWKRAHTPLIYHDNILIAVPGYALSAQHFDDRTASNIGIQQLTLHHT